MNANKYIAKESFTVPTLCVVMVAWCIWLGCTEGWNILSVGGLTFFAIGMVVYIFKYVKYGRKLDSKHGDSVVKRLSSDLKAAYPKMGMSVSNIWNMKRFYGRFHEADSKLQQAVVVLPWGHAEKDNVEVELALDGLTKPIGLAEYKLIVPQKELKHLIADEIRTFNREIAAKSTDSTSE